ncbi:MAG: T9SS type A sorting domain-containing protein, partial [Bacteroidetes bacterium]|nr:T9SS type A sorting domain-containing protein [Bacteroidota bacterium]
AFPHENGLCSVIGGVVYRGQNIPSLNGYYILSDACGFGDTQFFTLISDGNGGWIDQPLVLDVEGGFVPWTETKFAFGEDNKGEIYLCTRYFVYKLLFDATPSVDIGGEEINFHPNPVAPGALIRMNLSEVGNVERLSVFDSSGRLVDVQVSSANGDNASFYTTGLTNGVYSVHIDIVGSEEIVYGKFVVYGE